MSEGRRRQGFWLTAGEVVGVLALIVAALNLWDSHRQHVRDDRRAELQSAAAHSLVLAGEVEDDGRRLLLKPLRSDQAIQSLRLTFPTALSGAHDITASRPRIEAAWLAPGLAAAIHEARAGGSGEGRAPVLVETLFVEDGEARREIGLYDVGYGWRRRLLGGPEIRLQGLALDHRGGAGAAVLEARWRTLAPAPR